MLLRDFAEDPEKWASGAPIYIDASHGVITFFLKRWGTAESEKARKGIVKALYGPMHNHSEIDPDEIYAHWLAEYAITGWENIDEDDTKYTQRLARDVFLAKEHRLSINQKLMSQAFGFENYLFDEAMEELENIKKS